jgi:hypothetical protein
MRDGDPSCRKEVWPLRQRGVVHNSRIPAADPSAALRAGAGNNN